MLKDLLLPGLEVVFCGINPGIKSASDGHHFSGYNNRFWKALHQSGFTPYQIEAVDDKTILDFKYGLTTAVGKATLSADELSKADFESSFEGFKQKMIHYHPQVIAFLGKAAFQAFYNSKRVSWGLQDIEINGIKVWILPNPSGLNLGFKLNDLVEEYQKLYNYISKYRM